MTESNEDKKRVTCKRPHPNQRVHELLESLHRDAVRNQSDLVPALKEAISSLEKYPLPLSSGAECAILKGFDDKLCKYIDLHLNGHLSGNKKTKVTENGNSNDKRPRTPTLVEEGSDSEMASANKKNRKKNNELVTNTEKCLFASTFGESSTSSTGMPHDNASEDYNDSSKGTLNNNDPAIKSATSEKNNNKTTECLEELCSITESMDTYFINRSRKDALKKKPLIEVLHSDSPDDWENWESFTKADSSHSKNIHQTDNTKRCQPVQLVDDDSNSSDSDSVTEITSSSDESVISVQQAKQPQQPQPHECPHKESEVVICKQCESITTAADAFQLYFKDKMKRDAEEIGKCVLPRKMYKPAYRSGAYAILVALLEQRNECPYRDCLTKDELIQKAQKHTDQSFTNPKPESNYTAWMNAKRLINKGMIQITNYDHRSEDFYMLTAMGRAVSMELVKEHTPKVTINDVIFHGQRNDRVPSLEDVVLVPPPPLVTVNEEQSSVFIEMPPGTFDIVMLIDKRENIDTTLPASPNNYCKYEPRSLTIGDFLWVARSKKTGQELVLPYIVERKRIDDLASSIKDGRFHEQKFRLRKCGLKNVLYLVESFKYTGNQGVPAASLSQAVVNTSIQEEFNVVKTEDYNHTFQFLGILSERLVHDFLPKFLRGCNRDTQGRELMTFEFFNKYSSKNKPLTVRDTFIKMLLQLRGLSVEKALAITKKYNTPRALMKAYEKCNVKEGELLLSSLKCNHFTRTVGPSVSKTIYQLFSKLEF